MPLRVTASLIEELVRRKEELREKVKALLSSDEVGMALKDHHAHRKPIACGMTIHTGIGCDYGCLYCYVPDMGFPMKPTPYPLNGPQLVFALLSNPYIVVGEHGTMLALGSVTEPFMKEAKYRALEYLRYTRDYMRNPSQIATKSYLTPEDSLRLRESSEERLSVLVTITTIVNARRLEPGAPSPEERFETIRNLRRLGFHVSLFLRPIIPGVTVDLEDVIKRAADAGAVGIVPGSLRVTQGIIIRLTAAHFDINNVLKRLPHKPKSPREQVPIKERDLKDEVAKKAREYGLKVYPSSCSANMDAHGLACWLCDYGPCGDIRLLPKVYEEDVKDIVELKGFRYGGFSMVNNKIIIRVKVGSKSRANSLYDLENVMSTVAKRQVIVKADR